MTSGGLFACHFHGDGCVSPAEDTVERHLLSAGLAITDDDMDVLKHGIALMAQCGAPVSCVDIVSLIRG